MSAGRLKTLILATRPQFLPAIAVPVALGASTAWRQTGLFNPFNFTLSLFAALSYHAGMNVLNDYYDYKNGTDNINKGALTPFTGGSRFIQNGLLSPRQTLALGSALVASGSAIGIYLALTVSPLLFVIGLTGLLSGYFYSAPPLFLAGRGLGELTVGMNFGLLTVLGSYLVQTGTLSWEAFFVSLPVSFLIAALLFINEFPDYDADKSAKKKNLVVLIGPERARFGIIAISAAAYASLLLGVAAGFLPTASLIALAALIAALPGVLGLLRHYRGGPSLVPAIRSIILAHLATGLLQIISDLI